MLHGWRVQELHYFVSEWAQEDVSSPTHYGSIQRFRHGAEVPGHEIQTAL